MRRPILGRLSIASSCLLATGCSDTTTPPAPLAAVAIYPADTTIHQHDTFKPRVYVEDSAGHPLPLEPTLTSSDSTVVTITPQGALRSVGPVGTAVITVTLDSLVDQMVVHVIDSAIVARLPLPDAPLAVAIKGDVAYLTRPGTNLVQVLSLSSLSFEDSIVVGAVPCGVVFNSSGTKAYVANQFSNNVSIIDVATNTQTGTIPVTGNPLPVAISPNDSMLFVTTNVNGLYKIRLDSYAVVDSLPLPATSHYLLAHPNDTLLYVATRDAGSVLEVNWRTMTVVRTFTLGGRTQGMVLAPDRSELYVVNESTSQLHIVTLSSGSATNIPLDAGAHSIGLSADGTKLYVGLLFAGKISVFNRVAGTLSHTVVTGGTVRWMATDVARERMIVANESGWVDIVR